MAGRDALPSAKSTAETLRGLLLLHYIDTTYGQKPEPRELGTKEDLEQYLEEIEEFRKTQKAQCASSGSRPMPLSAWMLGKLKRLNSNDILVIRELAETKSQITRIARGFTTTVKELTNFHYKKGLKEFLDEIGKYKRGEIAEISLSCDAVDNIITRLDETIAVMDTRLASPSSGGRRTRRRRGGNDGEFRDFTDSGLSTKQINEMRAAKTIGDGYRALPGTKVTGRTYSGVNLGNVGKSKEEKVIPGTVPQGDDRWGGRSRRLRRKH